MSKFKEQILLVGPSPNNIGGLSTFIKNLYYSNIQNSFEFTLIIDQCDYKSYIKRFFFSFSVLFSMLKSLKTKKFSAVQMHCNSVGFPFLLKFSQILICKIANVRAVTRFGSGKSFSFFNEPKKFWILIFSVYFSLHYRIIVQSETAKVFYSNIIDNSKIGILHNFVPDKYISEAPDSGIPLSIKKNVMFVGGVDKNSAKSKGAYDLIDIISKNRPLLKYFNFFCIYPNSDLIKYSIKKRLFNRIIFLKKMPLDEIHAYYKSMHVLILLTRNDSMPNIIIELMAHGSAIISTDIGLIKDILHNGKGGFIVRSDDANLVNELLLKLRDMELQNQIKIFNKGHFEKHFSESVFISAFKKVYSA